jgi:threonine dehydrogenase-like Zn-dependent dehydrogenase
MIDHCLDKFPIGAILGKCITIVCGQTHVHNYMQPLFERIEKEEIHPSFIISHRYKLNDAPEAYKNFRYHRNECRKVVLCP